MAPAVPWLPLVEASTTVRLQRLALEVAGELDQRGGARQAAAVAGEPPSASREATITMLPLCMPGPDADDVLQRQRAVRGTAR